MANICSTQIRFFGNDDALTDFFNRIEHAISDEAHPDMSYCERRSFRNIANEFGIDPDKVSLRGDIEYDRDAQQYILKPHGRLALVYGVR